MSADNWAVCPRCLHQANIELAERQAETRAQYGKVLIAAWEQIAPVLAEEVDEEKHRTFREDYKFYGAKEGMLEISYHGECTSCKLKFEHKDAMTFWSPLPS